MAKTCGQLWAASAALHVFPEPITFRQGDAMTCTVDLGAPEGDRTCLVWLDEASNVKFAAFMQKEMDALMCEHLSAHRERISWWCTERQANLWYPGGLPPDWHITPTIPDPTRNPVQVVSRRTRGDKAQWKQERGRWNRSK